MPSDLTVAPCRVCLQFIYLFCRLHCKVRLIQAIGHHCRPRMAPLVEGWTLFTEQRPRVDCIRGISGLLGCLSWWRHRLAVTFSFSRFLTCNITLINDADKPVLYRLYFFLLSHYLFTHFMFSFVCSMIRSFVDNNYDLPNYLINNWICFHYHGNIIILFVLRTELNMAIRK